MKFFKVCGSQLQKTSSCNTIHIVYGSYIEDSINECEHIRWADEIDPLSRQFFIEKSNQQDKIVVLSGYMTDTDGICICIKATGTSEFVLPGLKREVIIY